MTGTDDDRRENFGAETAGSTLAAGDGNLMEIWDLFRWGKGFIALGLALGLAVSCFYYYRATPIYESKVEILVMQKDSNLATQRAKGGSDFQRESMNENLLSTHVQLFQSPRIIQMALEPNEADESDESDGDPDLIRVPTIAQVIAEGGNPTAYIAGHLTVTKGGSGRAKGADVIQATFQGPSPEDCAIILRAVTNSYQDFLGETFQDTSADAVELIGKAKDDIEEELQALEDERSRVRSEKDAPLLSMYASGTKERCVLF